MRKLLLIILLLPGCANMGGFIDTATEPGTDSRCLTGLGFELCYYRARTVDAD